MRKTVKAIANAISLAIMLPAAAGCALERRFGRRESVFGFWTHVVAMLPGQPGLYLRRAFYRLTLDACAPSFYIGFGALFTHRQARVASDVYIGPYSLVGCATLREGCLIASRVSLLSGAGPHAFGPDGRWHATESERLRQIEIGAYAWIGEGAIVMANVGSGSMVGAGSVVPRPVPSHVVVAGNPARLLRQLDTGTPDRQLATRDHTHATLRAVH